MLSTLGMVQQNTLQLYMNFFYWKWQFIVIFVRHGQGILGIKSNKICNMRHLIYFSYQFFCPISNNMYGPPFG
jgi:hypothetical protein